MASQLSIHPAVPGRVSIVQITDCHIYGEPGQRFDGVDTAATLEQVIGRITTMHRPPDLILATGDLVHEAEARAYLRLRQQLLTLKPAVVCLPGNHDDPGMLQEYLNSGNLSTSRTVDCPNWRIVMLDSYLAGSHNGYLSPMELDRLRQQLDRTDRDNLLVCLHHAPVSVNSSWMDGMMLNNPEELFAVLDGCTRVRGLVWGHIHQRFESMRNGVRLLGTPATSIQFTPGSDHFIRDSGGPGFRELILHDDGSIETSITWLE